MLQRDKKQRNLTYAPSISSDRSPQCKTLRIRNTDGFLGIHPMELRLFTGPKQACSVRRPVPLHHHAAHLRGADAFGDGLEDGDATAASGVHENGHAIHVLQLHLLFHRRVFTVSLEVSGTKKMVSARGGKLISNCAKYTEETYESQLTQGRSRNDWPVRTRLLRRVSKQSQYISTS